MREIKFKAWDMNCMLGPQGLLFSDTPVWIGNLTSEAILLQYTGLKDKNDIEIYEGDIIQSVCETVNLMSGKETGNFKTDSYEVRWQEIEGRWGRWRNSKFELLSGLNKSYLLKWYTVVGNIYENPELLSH